MKRTAIPRIKIMLIDHFLHFWLVLFSYFVPKNNRILIFGCGNRNEFQGHPKYLYYYLQSEKKRYFKPYWITESKEMYSSMSKKGQPVVYKYSFKAFWVLLRAKMLFHEKSSKDIYFSHLIMGRFNFFQTWHGTPLKAIGLDAINYKKSGIFYVILKSKNIYKIARRFRLLSMFKYKAILSPSKEMRTLLSNAFDNDRTLNLGYPRVDIFFNDKLCQKNMKHELNLTTYAKIILYAPTFRDHKTSVSPFTNLFLKSLNETLRKKNEVLLVKKHPWETKLVIPEGLSHIRDVSREVRDIQELLLHTDVLITDYSSVFFDFMVTEKPIIFYAYDLEDYLENCRSMYYDYKTIVPGPIIESENSLLKTLETVEEWSKKGESLKHYAEINERFNEFNDGNSCSRILEWVKNYK